MTDHLPPPDPALTLAERCNLATDCLPEAEYRTRLERLHGDMLAEIARSHALAFCGCGDGFTTHDPGTCGACVAGLTCRPGA